MQRHEKQDNRLRCMVIIAIVIYGICCAYLYYKQCFFVDGQPFESDLPFHISMAVDDHWFYSLTAIFYQIFYLTPFGAVLTAVFLTLVTIATIFATNALLQQLTEGKYPRGLMLFFAFSCNVLMPFFLEWAHFQRYIGYQSASIWHNSTYICMKLLSVWMLLLYVKYEKTYKEGITIKEWLLFAVSLVIANGIKPNFCMVFAPVMALFLLIDLIKKTPFRKIFIFGSAVLPSLAVILWQNMVLFGDETGNGIVINPGYTLSLRGNHPKITFILSIAFPLFILLFTIRDLYKDKFYSFAWIMWLVSFLEVFLFTEAGKRAKDANFLWGYSIGIFFITIMAVLKWIEKIKVKEGLFKYNAIRFIFLFGGGAIFLYQTYCGIFFFIGLLQGNSYWM